MDEPTSSLDEREVAVLFDVIRAAQRDGVAVIFVSHRLDELYAVCDRVTVMRDGRTVAVGRDGRHRQARAGGGHARARPRRRSAPRARPRFTAGARDGARAAARPSICGSADGCGTLASRCAPARSSGSPACSAPAAPRRRARCSAPTAPTAARSDDRRPGRSRSREPADAIAAGVGLLLARTARSRASSPTCRCART